MALPPGDPMMGDPRFIVALQRALRSGQGLDPMHILTDVPMDKFGHELFMDVTSLGREPMTGRRLLVVPKMARNLDPMLNEQLFSQSMRPMFRHTDPSVLHRLFSDSSIVFHPMEGQTPKTLQRIDTLEDKLSALRSENFSKGIRHSTQEERDLNQKINRLIDKTGDKARVRRDVQLTKAKFLDKLPGAMSNSYRIVAGALPALLLALLMGQGGEDDAV
jgi:hypothetical protein